ncbi:MAG: glycosyltransferase family 4 protein [Gemmatimonadetes bacterium]|nr:glycosyltransferase family 4 protein [Gemmatimonadota bacterium]
MSAAHPATGAALVDADARPGPREGDARPHRILCPTYWYPEHATDIHATYVHDINRHLVRRGHSVRVVTPGTEDLPLRDEFDGVEVVRFPFELPDDLKYGKVAQGETSAWGKINRILTMGRYLRAQYDATLREARAWGPDILHGHWAIPTGPAIVGAARRLGIPSVITLHGGCVYVNVEQGYDFPTRWYVRPILRHTLARSSMLTAITDDCREHALRAGAPPATLVKILNGADLERFSPESPNDRTVDFGPEMIFACRQLFPRKGIRFLIEAAAQLADEFPELRVVVAGDGIERPSLERRTRDLGIENRTTFLGWVPNADLPPYYRAAAISVLPSLEEGFGIPAAEAMGCEIPVVASDAGGLPEVVEDGVTGRVVPKGDATALAGALRELLRDRERARAMGIAGRERADRLFSWDRSAERFEAVYERCLSPEGSHAGDAAE